jgi:glutaredoxin 3
VQVCHEKFLSKAASGFYTSKPFARKPTHYIPVSDTKEHPLAKVTIYTKVFCPYCERALALLDKKGADVTNIEAASKPELRAELTAKTGRNTFPQIFIGDTHVGGCDDLMALDSKGGLDPLLAA